MDIIKWTKAEIELAKKNCDEYYTKCCDAALELIEVFAKQKHTEQSAYTTRQIFNTLAKYEPLTPLEDLPDQWNERMYKDNGIKTYQHKRYPGLFKDVMEGNKISYNDVDRFICYEADELKENKHIPFHNGFISNIMNKKFELDMPYYPEKYEVRIHECLADEKNGDFDTVAILDVKTPSGDIVKINRYYKENEASFTEITKSEYEERLQKDIERRMKADQLQEKEIQKKK